MEKALTITHSYRSDKVKTYLIRQRGTEGFKVIETGIGRTGWLEEALNWAFEAGRQAQPQPRTMAMAKRAGAGA